MSPRSAPPLTRRSFFIGIASLGLIHMLAQELLITEARAGGEGLAFLLRLVIYLGILILFIAGMPPVEYQQGEAAPDATTPPEEPSE